MLEFKLIHISNGGQHVTKQQTRHSAHYKVKNM